MTLGLEVDSAWLANQLPELTNIQKLGSGGFKDVYSAVHDKHGRIVLKLIHPKQDPEATRREIRAVNMIDSNRLPPIYYVGKLDVPNVGICVYFLERLIDGPTLRELLRVSPLPVTDLLKLGVHAMEALAAAESVKIVHRDVKPDNIMRDLQGNYWLLDFGIARHLTLDSITATWMPFGKCTYGYAPPEQMRNIKQDIDARADLFALGVTLYEAATGVNPFVYNARNDLEKMKRIEETRLPRLTLNFPSAGDFADLVDSLTQKRRHHRPETVGEALSWMREICAAGNVE